MRGSSSSSARSPRSLASSWWTIGSSSTASRWLRKRSRGNDRAARFILGRQQRAAERGVARVSKVTPLRKLKTSPDEVTRVSNLEVRLAEDEEEIEAAMALRYRVFYEEMSAKPSPEVAARGRDFDRFDEVCDHLLVVDNEKHDVRERVVGTYRLIRRGAAAAAGGFYSESEYDISQLKEYPGEILELGRSCVDANYRTRGTMQLLWKGIADYVWKYDVALMFGCASLPGTDPSAHAVVLTYLYPYHLAPPALRARAVASRFVE